MGKILNGTHSVPYRVLLLSLPRTTLPLCARWVCVCALFVAFRAFIGIFHLNGMDLFIVRECRYGFHLAFVFSRGEDGKKIWIKYWFVFEPMRSANESKWFLRKLVISFRRAMGIESFRMHFPFPTMPNGGAAWAFVWKSFERTSFVFEISHWMATENSTIPQHSQSRAIEAENKFFPSSQARHRWWRFSLFPFCWPWSFATANRQTFANFTVHRASTRAMLRRKAMTMTPTKQNAPVWHEKCANNEKCKHVHRAQQ